MSLSIQNSVVTQNSQLAFKGGKKGNGGQQAAELVDRAGFEIPSYVMLEKLKKSNPEAYKTAIRNYVEHKVLSMSNLEIIKALLSRSDYRHPMSNWEIIKALFKVK